MGGGKTLGRRGGLETERGQRVGDEREKRKRKRTGSEGNGSEY